MTSRRKSSSSRPKRQQPDFDALLHKRQRFTMTENGNICSHPTSDFSDSELEAARLGERRWVDRTEYLRLLMQSLHDLGYGRVAAQLEAETQIKHESQTVVELRGAVMNGDWDKALELLRSVPVETDVGRRRAEFLLIEEKFLEAVERKEWKTALSHLRTGLAPLNVNVERLHVLALCLLSPNVEDLKLAAQWEGPSEGSRERVLRELQVNSYSAKDRSPQNDECRGSKEIVPAHVMLPENRLLSLVEQALQSQMENCLFHNSPHATPSLFADYAVGMEQIPTEVVHELCDHTDEVWHVEFSNDGKSLASCSQDGVTIVWEINGREEISKKLELRAHSAAVLHLAWSPNDKYLATTSEDKTLKIWEIETGSCIRTVSEHTNHVTCLGWLPDSNRFISGSKDQYVVRNPAIMSHFSCEEGVCLQYMWNLEGRKLNSWCISYVVQDLVVSKAGDRLIVLGCDKKMRIYDLQGSNDVGIITCETVVSTITLSQDGTKLLASTQSRQIHLWEINPDLRGPQPTQPKKRYRMPELSTEGQKYMIRTCFGGYNEAFVLSGSEECKVYVWHKRSEKLVAVLEGHSGLVNSVSWNPRDPSMLASASDDKSVQIWMTKGGRGTQ